MVTDEELGAQLSARLTEELSDLTAPPGLAGSVRRRRTRQRLAWGGALGVPVVAAGVALALVVGQPAARPTGHSPAAAGSTGASDELHTVAYVAARTQQALGTADQYVVHETFTEDGAPAHQLWADGATPRMVQIWEPVANPPRARMLTADSNSMTLLDVNYQARTWSRDSRPGENDTHTGFTTGYDSPAQLRIWMAEGSLVLVGDEQVDGRAAVHLRLVTEETASGQADMQLWVDAESYLPLRRASRKGDTTFTSGYEWLPRTPQELAHLALTVPAGFREVSPFPSPSANTTPTPK
jgi:hypothetical protein